MQQALQNTLAATDTPPSDIAGVIDKTARFVATVGPHFEQTVLREAMETGHERKFL